MTKWSLTKENYYGNTPLFFQPVPNSLKRPSLQQPILYCLPSFPIPPLNQNLSESVFSPFPKYLKYFHMLMPLPMPFPCKHHPQWPSQWGTLIHPSDPRTYIFCSEKTSPSASSFSSLSLLSLPQLKTSIIELHCLLY